MKPTLLLALLSLACMPAPRPFAWEDSLGNVCEATCDGESCSLDLDCRREPEAACEDPDHACWFTSPVPSTSRFAEALGPDVLVLCDGCCPPAPEVGAGIVASYEASCAPLICDPEGQPPPAPTVCRVAADSLVPGYVYLQTEGDV